MSDTPIVSVTIPVEAAVGVSGLLTLPSNARAGLVLAHGAGAGMRHPFIAAVAAELAGFLGALPPAGPELRLARRAGATC